MIELGDQMINTQKAIDTLDQFCNSIEKVGFKELDEKFFSDIRLSIFTSFISSPSNLP